MLGWDNPINCIFENNKRVIACEMESLLIV